MSPTLSQLPVYVDACDGIGSRGMSDRILCAEIIEAGNVRCVIHLHTAFVLQCKALFRGRYIDLCRTAVVYG